MNNLRADYYLGDFVGYAYFNQEEIEDTETDQEEKEEGRS